MEFIPKGQEAQEVPFFEDVSSEGGWKGHTTGKSLGTLKSEIVASIGRLGGMVTGFQQGTFVIGDQERPGFQVRYTMERADGALFRGCIDVAALPVKTGRQRSRDKRQAQSLKMALYMLREALDGTWFLQQLSPGYAPLMPWMLDEASGRTISQLWTESASLALAPPEDHDFVEGEVIDG